MNENWQDGFKAALLAFLQKYRPDAVELSSWDEDYYPNYGGCPTCGPDMDYNVEFFYLNFQGKTCVWTYNGKFGELIDEMLGA